MSELLIAIALMCQVHPSAGNSLASTTLRDISDYSKKCHAYYSECMLKKDLWSGEIGRTKAVLECMRDRKI